ncbi:MAG: 4'-phosphopantetheinyl transferase superfamily protein [Flavobacterium sp.]
MIGNDVIDIKQSRHESNWQRNGFLQKLFTDKEQVLISNASDSEIMVWMLWSMKEAGYKIYNRQTKIRAYIPKKFSCAIVSQNDNYFYGKVNCLENIYYTKTIVSKEKIHTTAATSLEDLYNIREIAKKGVFKDNSGIPYLQHSLSGLRQDVSISNHGRFEKVVILDL